MPDTEHLNSQPAVPTPPTSDHRPRPRLAPRGFVRSTLAPIGVIALTVGTVAATRHQWSHLIEVAAVTPIAVLVQWAMTVRAAARRGVGIHPAALTVAALVMGVGIVSGLLVCALALLAPEALGLTQAGGAR